MLPFGFELTAQGQLLTQCDVSRRQMLGSTLEKLSRGLTMMLRSRSMSSDPIG